MNELIHEQPRQSACPFRASDRQLPPDIRRRTFLYRQRGVGTVEGEPPDTSRLSQRRTYRLYPVGRQNPLP